MEAREVQVSELFKSGQQLIVPIWQRGYSWGTSELGDLWEDIQRVRSLPDADGHFLGSVVLRLSEKQRFPGQVPRFELVDGQQRTTSLTLLLIALRDELHRSEAAEADRMTTRDLVNADRDPGYQRRLVLQHRDDVSLAALVEGKQPSDDLLAKAYRFLRTKVRGMSAEELTEVWSIVNNRLTSVWISLDEHDNAHRVFQTINAGGKPLRPSDLVRNYFFLLLAGQGRDFYEQHWQTLEDSFSPGEMEQYFSAWSVTRGHSGASQRLFDFFREDLVGKESDPEAIWSYGVALSEHSELFRMVLGQIKHPDDEVEAALVDLRAWGTKASEGLLLKLLLLWRQGRLNAQSLAIALKCIFSFFARRFVAGYQPNLHTPVLRTVTHRLLSHETATDGEVVELLRVLLSKGTELRRWPTVDLLETNAPTAMIYTSSRAKWAFGVLEGINRAMFSNPKFSERHLDREKYSVEHIMPQTLTNDWHTDLTDWGDGNPTATHATRLHVIGNLTLTPINPELSNRRWAIKREMIQDDPLKLNEPLKDIAAWTSAEINARSRTVAALLAEITVDPMSPAEMAASAFASEADIAEELDAEDEVE